MALQLTITPDNGNELSGTRVVLSQSFGTINWAEVTYAKFGGVSAQSLIVALDTRSMSCVVPPCRGSAGEVSVTISFESAGSVPYTYNAVS